jgi:hypothetical protein
MAIEWLEILLHNREVSVQKLCPEGGYPDWLR